MGILWSTLSALFDGFAENPVNIVMLGLDGAGKTTITYKLKLNETVDTIPTIGFNVETVSPKKGITFTVWDIGGQTKIRALWRNYLFNAQGLIYVVDSSDRERFAEAYDEMMGVLKFEEMAGVPLVLLVNKQDIPQAASCSEITDFFQLHQLRNRKWHVQGTCGNTGEGLYEAMDTLASLSKEFKKPQRS